MAEFKERNIRGNRGLGILGLGEGPRNDDPVSVQQSKSSPRTASAVLNLTCLQAGLL